MSKTKQLSEPGARFDRWLAEVRALRAAKYKADADFFSKIQFGEGDEEAWRAKGYATFSDALIGENICDSRPYEAFKAAVARFGLERVRAFGFEQIRLVVRVPKEAHSRREPGVPADAAILAEAAESALRNGVPPSPRQVAAIVRKHHEPESKPPPAAPVDIVATLKARIADLTKENRRLTRELAKVTKERDLLRGRASAGLARESRPPLA